MDNLLREANDRGVNLALNSLSGEFLHASIAKWGTMVESRKRDILGNTYLDMGPFLANRNYCCLHVEQMRIKRP